MTSTQRLAAATAAVLLAAAGATGAAQTPPLKPGLWLLQMQPDDPALAARLRELQARLQNAPPQLRQMAESMLRQQGMAAAGGDSVRLCLNAADLNSGAWLGLPRGGACTTTLTPGGSNGSLRFHTHCTSPVPSDTEGEARFSSADHYSVNSITTVQTGSGSRSARLSGQAHWLGASCGELGR